MTTKSEKIAELKAIYPTLQQGSDEVGYTQLDEKTYEVTIEQWAENELTQAQAATDKAALLAKLGITADEAKLLLS